MPEKIKRTDIEACPNWDLLIGCWNCPYFDNEKGKKENCPYHENQNYYSQKKKLWMLGKAKLNSEFGKLAHSLKLGKRLKGEKQNV